MSQYIFSNCDIVIIGDDVWISREKPKTWYNEYEREDIIHAKDYDPARGTHDYSRRRPNGTSSGRSNGGTGSYHYLVDESGIREGNVTPPVDPLESWCDAWNQHYQTYRGEPGPFRPTI